MSLFVFEYNINTWVFNLFQVFQSIIVIILFDAQIIPSLTSGRQFKLSLATFSQDSTSLFWQDKMPRLLPQTWNQLFLQGILVPFYGKWYVETTVWVLRVESLFKWICSAPVCLDNNFILLSISLFPSLMNLWSHLDVPTSPLIYNSQCSCDSSPFHQADCPTSLNSFILLI